MDSIQKIVKVEINQGKNYFITPFQIGSKTP